MKNDTYKQLSDLVIESMKDPKRENEELQKLLAENGCSSDLIETVASKEHFANTVQMLDQAFEEKNVKELLSKIEHRELRHRRVRRIILSACGSVAAAILALSFYLLTLETESTTTITSSVPATKTEKPILIINNSERIELEGDSKHTIAENYSKNISTDSEEVVSLRLIVPASNTHLITLEDGSEVLLNANSELIYPSKFNDYERRVELRGEAFFTVKKGDKPFIVNANNSYVRVFGTSFNINAQDQDLIQTILVEGSVGVGLDESSMTLIKPNQIATINTRERTQNISDINIDNHLAWRNGLFKFIDADFNVMINEFENWYGINFQYDEKLFNELKVNFSINRTSSIEKTLDFIQTIFKIKITEKGGGYQIERTI